jgi:site-specific recombinase XerC
VPSHQESARRRRPARDLAAAVAWAERNTVKLTALADAALIRKALDALAMLIDGGAASASTVARKRAVFSGALRYAVEPGHLDAHPMARVSWIAPKNADEMDRQVVANPRQARACLRL